MNDAIALKRVRKHYGAVQALDGLDLAVPAGATFGLIGPNGAGKTTTFAICCGFVGCDAGEVRVLGHAPRPFGALKGRLGALPQDAQLPRDDRLADALAFFGRLAGRSAADARRDARDALEKVGLGAELARRCGGLSHGMAKRAAIAQAFLGEPELILLDEPTAGLDPKSAHETREIVRALSGRRTVVVSSHNLQEIETLCNFAAILDHGRVVAAGPMAALKGADAEIVILLAAGALPLDAVKAARFVKDARFDPRRGELVVLFDAREAPAEDVIGSALTVLLQHGARVKSVQQGKGLEERVLEVTR